MKITENAKINTPKKITTLYTLVQDLKNSIIGRATFCESH